MQNLLNLSKYLKKKIPKNNQVYLRHKKNSFRINEKYQTFSRVTQKFDNNILIREGGKRVKGFFRRCFQNKPLISIITVVFNDEKDLENTIKSVLLQDYDNLEFIIIDGGSSGKVITKIKKYENYIDYWISQKDLGIWDAWNKGIRLSTGKFICFLNVGDFFTENSINTIVKTINKNENLDIIFGAVKKKKIYAGFYPKKISMNLNIFPSFVSTFVSSDIYKKYGLFDLNFKYFNDYEFVYRLIKKKKLNWVATSQNKVITVFDLKGYSSKIGIIKRLIEEFKIRLKYENFFLIFFKIFLKFFRFYYLKIFKTNKFIKYN
tara:strand:- start:10323 stop:11282 length:960 start_codon:yes stop_codon:yes gene_type:complete